MMRRTLAAVGFGVALMVPDVARACSCAILPVCTTLSQSELVFVGRAERVTKLGPGSEKTEFVVREMLSGAPTTTLGVYAHGLGGSCDRSFEQGREYLVFASRRDDRTWRVFLCTNTDEVDRVPPADLDFLRRARAAPLPASITGQVVVRHKAPATPEPLAGARLTLRGGGREISAQTNDQGQYTFKGVAPGDYMVHLQVPDDGKPIPPTRITLVSGACAVRMIEVNRGSSPPSRRASVGSSFCP
jgi:hypothetical protein